MQPLVIWSVLGHAALPNLSCFIYNNHKRGNLNWAAQQAELLRQEEKRLFQEQEEVRRIKYEQQQQLLQTWLKKQEEENQTMEMINQIQQRKAELQRQQQIENNWKLYEEYLKQGELYYQSNGFAGFTLTVNVPTKCSKLTWPLRKFAIEYNVQHEKNLCR